MMAVTSVGQSRNKQQMSENVVGAAECRKQRGTESEATVKALNPFPALVSLTADVKHTAEIKREESVH